MDTIFFAKEYISDLRSFATEVLGPKLPQANRRTTTRWEASLGDVIKVNFDASLQSPEDGCGLGWLGRCSDGRCVAWFSTRWKQYLDPITAEAIASLKVLQFVRDHHFPKAILESDSSIFVAAVEGEIGSRSSYENIISDIKLLANTFEEFQIRHVLREGNRTAHEIVKLSCRVSFMSSVIPRFITHILMSESPS
ncbi:PREDICTED: uncharacterized protein LOC105966645 [Erythranthe guttata]|uniref:uncharacterized protein LOC105966645 n=1 Tax=Erythranthe guttata TaxID=4155 RepID=UPI00064DC4C8|nr:PREDICTED: uncharacterized protein LOC105966645 [Erythranthe guttata]|eukprot:XP_012846694.1 PREDICTED: uncharacterized protein LOC105966645 [Erythranthe guttata]